MILRVLLCSSLILPMLASTACGAMAQSPHHKVPATKNREYSAEVVEEGADRGVLGVRYAIGIDLLRKTHILVDMVVKGGPSEKAGLRKGDQIIEINGRDVRELKRKQIGALMRGEPGTLLKLTVKRGAEILPINLVRGNLTELPDRDFQSRMLSDALAHERDTKITSLAESLKSKYPDLSAAIAAESYLAAAEALGNMSKTDSDTLLLYGLLLAKLKQPNAVDVLKQVMPTIADKETEQLVRDVIADMSAKPGKSASKDP
jgi:membrane-associated protease RseP (regulator of RpoE activity)